MKIHRLKAEYKTIPLGIETQSPRLCWEIVADEINIVQTAYQIKAAYSFKQIAENDLIWDSQKVNSDQSIHVKYNGPELKSGQRIYWQVKVWNNKGNEAVSDEISFWEMGLLNPTDWKALWINSIIDEDISDSTPCTYFRKEFVAQKSIKEARVYASALGLYQLQINGKRISDQLFTPGWTSYQKRIQYQVYDVTETLNQGENTIGAILGDGWYRGFFVWQGNKNLYGDKSALIAQLKITYDDGSVEWIVTDESWLSSTGPILKSDIYNGETYDARLEMNGWVLVGFNAENWKAVQIVNQNTDLLVSSEGADVRITETIKPIEKIITPKGELVFDLGQNMVGWVQFKLKGEKGTKITLSHAEVLDPDGNFYIDNLREAKAEDVYIFKGEGIEFYEPHFTFHGFRYIKISDYEGDVSLNDISGRVIHSDMDTIGEFECSDEMINQLQKNIQWGLRGNFLDVPTDCPQRDERLGWTGDAQVFASTACFNVNAAPFYTKWMKDLAIEQKEDGSVPWVVPNVVKDGGGTGWSDGFGATGWADAAVIIPWEVYKAYGDKTILENQYDSMKAWALYMKKHAGERYIFDYGFHFGDWLSFAEYYTYNYNAPDYGYAGAYTEKELIATAYFYYTTGLIEQIASLLNKNEDAKQFASIRPKIKEAFKSEFVTNNGRLTSNTQTAYTLALAFGIMPDEMRDIAAKRLADDVAYFGHLTSGFLGTPLLCDALADNGYPELAFQLLFNKRYPSWLYPVTMGATTIWERWDGIKPDGTFQDVGMNSFNHYAYGAVGKFLYSKVAGLDFEISQPGYKSIVIKPIIADQLNHAKASLQSMYGLVSAGWKKQNNELVLEVTIPANTRAKIYLPCKDVQKVRIDEKKLSALESMFNTVIINKGMIISVGSGNYYLTCPLK